MLTARTALRGTAAAAVLALAATLGLPAASAHSSALLSQPTYPDGNGQAYFADMLATMQKAELVVDFALGVAGEDGNTFPLADEDLHAAATSLDLGYVEGGRLVLPGTYDTFALDVDRESGKVDDGGSLIEEELAGPAARAVAERIGTDLSQLPNAVAAVQDEVNATGSAWGPIAIIPQPTGYLRVALVGDDKPVYLYELERQDGAYRVSYVRTGVTQVTKPVTPVDAPGMRSSSSVPYSVDVRMAKAMAQAVIRNAEALSALDGDMYPLSLKNLRQAAHDGSTTRYRKGVLTIRGDFDVHRFQAIRKSGELRELPSQHRVKFADPLADQIFWNSGPRLENLDIAVRMASLRAPFHVFIEVRGGALYIGLKGVDRPAFRYFITYENGFGRITFHEGVVSIPTFP